MYYDLRVKYEQVLCVMLVDFCSHNELDTHISIEFVYTLYFL